jgi:hypothetical protein
MTNDIINERKMRIDRLGADESKLAISVAGHGFTGRDGQADKA